MKSPDSKKSPEPPVLVSACLGGLCTTHDAAAKPHPHVLELVRAGRALLVCPEQLGGLPTPRPAAEIQGGGAKEVLENTASVRDAAGNDVSTNFVRGAQEALKVARMAGVQTAILKARSPSCGVGKTYDGSFSGELVEGDGVTAALLKASGITVLSEEDL